MRILHINDKSELELNPELVSIEPFATIWKRDESEYKIKAIAELSFIYYMCDISSMYYVIESTPARQKHILDDGILPDLGDDYKPDTQILKAFKFYKEKQDTDDIVQIYKTARDTLAKLRTHLSNINFGERSKQGTIVNDPKAVAAVLKDLRYLTKELRNAEIDVLSASSLENEFVGNEKKSLFDDELKI